MFSKFSSDGSELSLCASHVRQQIHTFTKTLNCFFKRWTMTILKTEQESDHLIKCISAFHFFYVLLIILQMVHQFTDYYLLFISSDHNLNVAAC